MARASIHSATDGEKTDMLSVGAAARSKVDGLQVIEVVLSEKNLLSLLSKLYIRGSHRTIYNDQVPKGYILKLVSEDDDSHYGARDFPAGHKSDESESLVHNVRKTLEAWEKQSSNVVAFKKGVAQARGEDAQSDKSECESKSTTD